MTDSGTTDRQAPRRIVLLGLFGVGNLGNDATLDVTLHHLRQRVSEPDILCVCGNPSKIQRIFGISAAPFNFLPPWSFWQVPNRIVQNICVVIATLVTEPFRRRKVARAIRGAQQLLIVGTGILDDFGELPWRVPLWLWRWCAVAKQEGIRVEFVAVGAGPINARINRLLMMKAVRISDRRTFRDRVSKDYLTNLGLDTSHDHVAPDLVFGLPAERIPRAHVPLNPPRTIGVGLMAYYGWDNNKESGKATYSAYIAKMSRFVSWLLDNDYEVHLLIGQEGADEKTVMDLRDALAAGHGGTPIASLVSKAINSVDALLAEIACTDIVIATRYHNVIGALLLGRPVISIGYADKFDDLMREMRLDPYSQHIEQLDVERLIEQFRSLISDHSRVVNVIHEKCRSYRAQVEQVFDSLWS